MQSGSTIWAFLAWQKAVNKSLIKNKTPNAVWKLELRIRKIAMELQNEAPS